jgi:hypothetical protein
MPNSFILVLFHEIFAGSVVQGKSTTIKSSKGAVDVLQGNGFLSSLQSARKPVSMVNPKLSMFPIPQGAKSSCKAAKTAPPINCRQVLNHLRMKNKWSTSPAYKLMNDESMSHIQRLASTPYINCTCLVFLCKPRLEVLTLASHMYHHFTFPQAVEESLTLV